MSSGTENPSLRKHPWLLPLLAGLAVALTFIALNHSAYDGYFQDDELDNLSWAPRLPMTQYFRALLSPLFSTVNFRPVGHLYFALMGRGFGLDFPPYITPLFGLHLVNALLLFFLMRSLGIRVWSALAGVAFFTLTDTAFDVFCKPMYVFDMLATTFSLATVLLYAKGRLILSFVAFWLAYKSKELAVMLPFVLLAYEYFFGRKRFIFLLPFFLSSLSFGLQGILRNPNKNNDYTFRFTASALLTTTAFYSSRFLAIPFAGVLLLLLAFLRDSRVWFGLIGLTAVMVPLLFLPGRLFEAYTYLPLTFVVIAVTAAFSRVDSRWALLLLVLWMPFNVRDTRAKYRPLLSAGDSAFHFVSDLAQWTSSHNGVDTLVYDSVPGSYHDWGITAAWNLVHHTVGLPALWFDSNEARNALRARQAAYAHWNPELQRLNIEVRQPIAPLP